MPKSKDLMKPSEKRYFSKVGIARELLKSRTEELLRLYLKNIKLAQEKGEFEVVQKSIEFLMAHAPKDTETGVALLDQDIDKVQVESGKSSGPSINIGFQLGGIQSQKKLKAKPNVEVIEIEPEKEV